jgi:type IV secretion system protein VirD4
VPTALRSRSTCCSALQDRYSRYRSSVIATRKAALDPWLEPSVARAAGTAGGINPAWLLDGRNTLYLSAPAYDQQRLSGLFTTLINAAVEEAFARSSRTGQPIDPPVLLCLDEAANVAPLPTPGEIASTAAGQGAQVLSVFQNLSQISERWGRDRAETMMANHVARARRSAGATERNAPRAVLLLAAAARVAGPLLRPD